MTDKQKDPIGDPTNVERETTQNLEETTLNGETFSNEESPLKDESFRNKELTRDNAPSMGPTEKPDPKKTIGWVMKITMLLVVVLAGLFYFLAEDPMPMVVGVAFGTIFSLLNFRLLHLTIQKSLNMSPNQAKSYVSSRYIIRYLLAGAMLFVAITNPSINVLGAVLGLLIIKGVIFSLNFSEAVKKWSKDKKE